MSHRGDLERCQSQLPVTLKLKRFSLFHALGKLLPFNFERVGEVGFRWSRCSANSRSPRVAPSKRLSSRSGRQTSTSLGLSFNFNGNDSLGAERRPSININRVAIRRLPVTFNIHQQSLSNPVFRLPSRVAPVQRHRTTVGTKTVTFELSQNSIAGKPVSGTLWTWAFLQCGRLHPATNDKLQIVPDTVSGHLASPTSSSEKISCTGLPLGSRKKQIQRKTVRTHKTHGASLSRRTHLWVTLYVALRGS